MSCVNMLYFACAWESVENPTAVSSHPFIFPAKK